MTDNVYDFAAASVFHENGEVRHKRISVAFRILSYGKIEGYRLNGEFYSDYGLFFDPDDEYIRSTLTEICPEIDWEEIIFHRCWEAGLIFLTSTGDFKEIGEIRLRRIRQPRKVLKALGSSPGDNVLMLRTRDASRKEIGEVS